MHPQGGDHILPLKAQSPVSPGLGHSGHSFGCTLCSDRLSVSSTKRLRVALSYVFKTPSLLSFSVPKPDTDLVTLHFPSDHDCLFYLNQLCICPQYLVGSDKSKAFGKCLLVD